MSKKSKIEETEEKSKKKKQPRRNGVNRRRYAFTPSWHMQVVPSIIRTDDVHVRQLEYLDAISELSGSSEGTELESLSNLSHETFKKNAYEEPDPFEEVEGNFDE